jgi:hypothetical protein
MNVAQSVSSKSPEALAKPAAIAAAKNNLDAHVREIVKWHFSPATGSPFWLEWAKKAGWNPAKDVKGFADLLRFPNFTDDWLRDEQPERWVPKAYAKKPYMIFETGGTTGMPKQRVSWEDHLIDYSEFSTTLDDKFFPKNAHWLMAGPTGPRRLRLAIEHLANVRGGSAYHIDLDPRWVKRLIGKGEYAQAEAYKEHVVDQAIVILRNRKNIHSLFTTPKILEAMAERTSLPGLGIKGVFCGGTSMTPQVVRFLAEEVLEGKAQFVPTYGNTLMGLACSRPVTASDNWSVTYHAPQPRAVLRVVNPDDATKDVAYGAWGRVELTTLTKEFFMPRLLERDEAWRREPIVRWPWDGVADVRPFGASSGKIIEGVY